MSLAAVGGWMSAASGVASDVRAILRPPARPNTAARVRCATVTVGVGLAVLAAGGGARSAALAGAFVLATVYVTVACSAFCGAAHAGLVSVVALAVCGPLGLLSWPAAVVVAAVNVAAVAVLVSWIRGQRQDEADEVTGLANERGLRRQLDVVLSSGGEGFACVLVKVAVHPADDSALLAEIPRTWLTLLPPTAVLGHGQPGEFTVVLPHRDLAAGAQLLTRLVAALPAGTRAHGGAAAWRPGDGAASLTARADLSLLRGAETEDGVDPELQSAELVRDLRRAIADRAFTVLYQPVVDLVSGTTVAAEALVRWTHPVHGPLSPDQFVPAAEHSGLIVELGRQVLSVACRQARRLEAEGRRLERLAVNVSPRQLDDPDFHADVVDVLAATGWPPDRLVLEVTESSLGADRTRQIATLERLRRLGIRIAIDDFGTGHSSLSRLTQLPVDILKIDKSFVAAVADQGDSSVVTAIVLLAKAMNLDTVAEGVELPEQEELLRSLGCRKGQGWLYGRPVAAAQLSLPPVPAAERPAVPHS